jgi:hypothetical protein
MEDELDSLREKSARASDVYGGLEGDSGTVTEAVRGLSPQHRLILAILLVVDIFALLFALLVFTGRISF